MFVQKEDPQSMQSRMTFLENLVCSKITNLNLSNQDESIMENIDIPKAEAPILVEEKVIFNLNSVILRYALLFIYFQKCTEWWCPRHSNFKDILDKIIIKDQSTEDKYIIRKAKARYVYWQGEKNKVILIYYLKYSLLNYSI